MQVPLVSVIIPIYNAGDFFGKCIESVIFQTYDNLEIILVNDGSTDGSDKICREFAQKDNRIKFINEVNQGVVRARKAGAAAATGDFIAWVDADDWIERDYIEKLVQLQQESKADIVAVGHYHDIGKDSVLNKNGLKNGIYTKDQVVKKMLYTGKFYEYGILPHLFTKLFKADILKATQAVVTEDIIAGDDVAVVYPSILKAERICVSDIAGYHYIQHSGSITKTDYSNEYERVGSLLSFLKKILEENHLSEVIEKQLCVYKHYLLSLRQIDYFDKESESVLISYGGISAGKRVVIYGAGVLGQRIYRYLKTDERVLVVGWLDKNYKTYQKSGFEVQSPDEFDFLNEMYDYILIANITEDTVKVIKGFLLTKGVSKEKIRWFSKEFRQSDREL